MLFYVQSLFPKCPHVFSTYRIFMAHCSIYVKMEKGPQPGKFSLTAVLLTFSDLSHSQQTKTLSSSHIHYCCF